MLELKAVSKACFQNNPEYELLPIVSAASEFSESQDRSKFSAVIRSKSSGAGKKVCSETANLLLSIKERGTILETLLDAESLDTILAQFILDNILQILWNGVFVGGPSAWPALFEGEFPEQRNHCLSTAALRYAQALRLKDELQLSRRLYGYNCVPITHFWRKLFPDHDAVIQFLSTNSAEEHLKLSLSQNGGWLTWQARNGQFQQDQPRYKLYLSPQIAALQECWTRAFPIFTASNAVGLKIGADAYGLLRPDKIVAHFKSQEALMITANQLREELAGFPCQGVPFAAKLDKSGLLSWGVDLPSANHESWRSWITHRLAVSMIAASEVDLPVEPWQYAVGRLQLEGVNTMDWTPTPELLQ
jgi:hypothetical protein